MASKKFTIKQKTAEGYDVLLPETISEQVTDVATGKTMATIAAENAQHMANVENPHGTTKAQVGLGSVQNYGLATQAEAEAGTSSAKYMTPLRTKQTVDKALVPVTESVQSVNDTLAKHAENFIAASKFGNVKNSAMIQAALNFAKGLGGGHVYVAPGTYDVTETIKVPSNVKLFAMGKVILKRMGNILAIIHNDADGVKGNYDANVNITISGFTLDANNVTYPDTVTSIVIGHASDVIIENCEFLNCATWHDVEINGSKHVIVRKCVFPNYNGTSEILQPDYMGSSVQFPWFGPYNGNPCIDLTIDDCRFYGDKISFANPLPVRTSIRAIGKHSHSANSITEKVRISNCYFEGFEHAVFMQDTHDMLFENCHFLDCRIAIVWEEATVASKNWVFNKCTYRHSTPMFNAFGTLNTESRFILGATNTPTNHLYGLVVSECLIEGSTWNAIGGTFKNAKIINNIIRHSRGNGIYLFGGSKLLVSDNILENNNRNQQAGRADIVIGNNTPFADLVIVKGNIANTIINGGNVSNSIYTDNFIFTSLTGISGSAVAKNNFIAGVYTP